MSDQDIPWIVPAHAGSTFLSFSLTVAAPDIETAANLAQVTADELNQHLPAEWRIHLDAPERIEV